MAPNIEDSMAPRTWLTWITHRVRLARLALAFLIMPIEWVAVLNAVASDLELLQLVADRIKAGNSQDRLEQLEDRVTQIESTPGAEGDS